MTEQELATTRKVEDKVSKSMGDKKMLQMPENIKQLRRFVKDKITDKWEEIAIQLGFTPAQIQAIKKGHEGRSVKTCCTDMLFDWIDNTQSSNPPKDLKLVEAIREVGYGYQADQFKEEMKTVDDILEQRYLQTKIIPEIAVRWFEIGLELDIPHGKLEIIKRETDYSGACCLDMLALWFNRGKNVEEETERPIWKNMYDAMCAIDLKFRAGQLRDSVLKDIN